MFEAEHCNLFYRGASSRRRRLHQQPVGDIVATCACSRRQPSPPPHPSSQVHKSPTARQTVLTPGVQGGRGAVEAVWAGAIGRGHPAGPHRHSQTHALLLRRGRRGWDGVEGGGGCEQQGVSIFSSNPPSIASAKLKSGSSSRLCDHLDHFRDTLESTKEKKSSWNESVTFDRVSGF